MVYVDDARHIYGRMIMSHMTATNEQELHDMVDKIGISRTHFQNINKPHYDICQSKKRLAIRHGAIQIPVAQLIFKARMLKKRMENEANS